MKQRSYSGGEELPLGLSMCMAQNPYAYSCFARLSNQERRELISRAERTKTASGMNEIVDGLVGGGMVSGNARGTM